MLSTKERKRGKFGNGQRILRTVDRHDWISHGNGLLQMLEKQVSHDQMNHFLREEKYTSNDLWLEVKEIVHKVGREERVLIINDLFQEKPYTDENEVMRGHYDHSKGRAVQELQPTQLSVPCRDVSLCSL
jgi:hypothetical protein